MIGKVTEEELQKSKQDVLIAECDKIELSDVLGVVNESTKING